MVYLPTFAIKIKQMDIGEYTIHGSYGIYLQSTLTQTSVSDKRETSLSDGLRVCIVNIDLGVPLPNHTVDARNPAPPGKNLVNNGINFRINWCRISSINSTTYLMLGPMQFFFQDPPPKKWNTHWGFKALHDNLDIWDIKSCNTQYSKIPYLSINLPTFKIMQLPYLDHPMSGLHP